MLLYCLIAGLMIGPPGGASEPVSQAEVLTPPTALGPMQPAALPPEPDSFTTPLIPDIDLDSSARPVAGDLLQPYVCCSDCTDQSACPAGEETGDNRPIKVERVGSDAAALPDR